MQLHTVIVDKGDVPNMVSVHKFIAAAKLKEHISATAMTPSSSKNETLTMEQKEKKKIFGSVTKIQTTQS